jgi:hypothetical protein
VTNLIGPLLIFLGIAGLAYGIYIMAFARRAPRDRRSARQKNLDAIAEIRGDKKRPPNPAKNAKAASRSR